ncbi:Integrase, catalytic core [Cinnamomum micranthum f. kanehirae]|uniref:Integrase, catalytic core n=1 Tax=Cinnamomum micranthum f. kanehirae TaxID=337451 RepID=A0A443N8T5_9MAGN|nr:Integrase, catalytic core [Cinnamomum micranthum f. kanehirae]
MNGGSNVSIDKLVGNNYNYWKLCMEAYLQGQDLWDLISGDNAVIPEDTSQNADLWRKWKIKCGKALFALRTSISQDYIARVRDVSSPKQVWEILERLFTQKNTMRLQYLENELAGMTQGTLSIPEYFLKVKTLCAEISELDTEEPVSDARLHRYLIRGLRKEFMPFISSIQGWATQPSIIELENLLSNQEALVKQMTSNDKKSLSLVEDALYTKDQGNKNFFKQGSDDTEQSNNEGKFRGNSKGCFRCGQLGHIKRDCHARVVCNRCGKSGHIKANCRVKLMEAGANVAQEKDESEQSTWEHGLSITANQSTIVTSAQTDVNASIDYNDKWIVDSGCSHHATGNYSLLSDVRPHCGKKTIVTADNSLYPVEKEGHFEADISNNRGVSLNNVYHVSGLKKNLASVSQITDARRYVLFGPKNVQILSNIKHIEADVLFTGRRKESLYVLSASDAYVEKTCQNESATLWHSRLGHVGYQLLQKISTKKLLNGIPLFKEIHHDVVCPGCQYRKSHRLPFPTSKNRASTVLQLVHSDLMGPTKTLSYSSFRYVMILVDDFSRFTWVYFLENKSEAFSKFVQFKEQVEKEFELQIKCLRTDNGGEYMSDQFLNYCKEHGIQHQMTCPETPQQNGVAERKLAHLTSMCLSWLHTKNLPRELWAAAVQSACHVINRLPAWPGTEPSPFEALYHHKPNVSYFQVFGSDCYVHISKTIRTKLDPRARRCIFVGYDAHRKGWKCMDPETKKVDVSRDVVFDEVSSLQIDTKRGTIDFSPFPDRGSCEDEPTSYNEAKGISEWEEAMQEEISALNKNCTWELVSKPKNVTPVTCKWVYKLKKRADGTIDRYKARLVACGFSQQYGLDYDETFSHVAKMVTIRTIISLAAYKGWKLWQLDVKNAFLYGELDRDIFMEQPHGFISKEFPNHVCRLKKALYGLKQAPRAWYGKIAQYLEFCGFKSSNADSSLFVKKTSSTFTMLLLYVDDMIITGDDDAEITSLQDALSLRFEMKSLGEASCFLGLEVKKSDGYFVSQTRYATRLLERFRMEESKIMDTPMDPSLKLIKDGGRLLKDATLFRQLVGSLFYLTITRPDISFPVGVVSQFMDKPRESHFIAAKRILRYIKGTLNFGLFYQQHTPFMLTGFVDADWAGDLNDRCSTTGYCFNMGSAAISWCSKKQTTVALSSCEAEYVAATMATQECIWLKRLIQEMFSALDYPIPIHCDNESAIKLAGNPVFHARTKHIETHFHFAREKVLTQDIQLQKIRTDVQVADIFTKALGKAKFEVFRDALGIVDRKFALRGSVAN